MSNKYALIEYKVMAEMLTGKKLVGVPLTTEILGQLLGFICYLSYPRDLPSVFTSW